MQTEVDSFFGVIREIELFAKGDKTKLREPVNLNESVRKILQQSEQLFERGIDVRPDLSTEPPITRGHYVELEQAFIMVVNNAVEAMPDGGTLTIQTAISGGDAIVRFTDTGIGMDEPTRKRATDPFYTTKRDHGGTGMGLAVVLGVVTRHSGTFDIKSEPGKGTVIEMRFKQEVVS
jgi:signal transduction histidine kinase